MGEQPRGRQVTLSEAAWALLALALPLTIAGANGSWMLLTLALLSAGALSGWRRAPLPLAAPLAAALAAGLLSTALARTWNSHALLGDLHRLWISVLFGVGAAAISHRARRRTGLFFALGAAAASLVGICQAVHARAATGLWGRAHAWVHPVTYGELIAFAALGAAALLAAPEQPFPRRRAAWAWAALALYGAALILSGTRGAVLGFGAGVLVMLLAAPRLRRLSFLALPALAAAFAAADRLPGGGGRSLWRGWAAPTRGWAAQGGEQYFRFTLWHSAWGMFLERPITGVGPGNYRANYSRFAAVGPDNEATAGSAHNLIAHQLAERGLLGFACVAWLFAVLWIRAWRRSVREVDAFGLWAVSATAAFAVMNLTEVALQVEQVWMTFFFIWSLGVLGPAEAAA